MMENSNHADAFPCGVANPHTPEINKGIRFIVYAPARRLL